MSDQGRHESPEIGAMICRMMNALIQRADAGDWEALEALALVERTAPAAMTAGLAVARQTFTDGKPSGRGYSLAELAGVVGVTRSAVAQRTAPKVGGYAGTSGCGHARCVGVKRCRIPKAHHADDEVCTGPGRCTAGYYCPVHGPTSKAGPP